MRGDGISVLHDVWTKSGRGLIEDSSDVLAAGVDSFCAVLAGAGQPFGSDQIGQTAFIGDGTAQSPGFRAIRDDTLTRLAAAVNVLRQSGAGLMSSGRRYALTEQTVVASVRAGGAASEIADQRGPAVDAYAVPPVADHLVRSMPPPPEWKPAISLIESLTVGCSYPDGDSDHVRQIRNVSDTMAAVLDEVNRTATFYVGEVTRNNSGTATDAFVAYAAGMVGDKGELADLAAQCRGLAQYCDLIARNIDAGRLRFGLSIEFVLISFALAPLLGIAEGMLLSAIEADGVALRLFLVMCAKQVLIGAWFCGGMNAMGQMAQLEEHLQTGFDLKDVLLASAQGAVAGLLMAGAQGALATLGGRFSALGTLADLMGSRGPLGAVSRLAVGGTIGTAANLATEAMFNDGHVDVVQAVEAGFGMAALGEAMEAGKPAVERPAGLIGRTDALPEPPHSPDAGSPSRIDSILNATADDGAVAGLQHEAQQVAEQHGATNLRIDFSGMDATSARAITDGVRELAQQSPARLRDLNHIQSTDFVDSSPGDSGPGLGMDAYSVTSGDARGVYLNSHSFGDSTALDTRGAQQEADGYTVPGGGTAKGIFFHEVGHLDADEILGHPALRDALTRAVSDVLGTPYDIAAHGHDPHQLTAIEEHLSILGGMDPHQMIAEASAEYRMSDEPRPLAAAIGEVIRHLEAVRQDRSPMPDPVADENPATVHARYTPPPESGRPRGADRLAAKADEITGAFERSRRLPGVGEKVADLLRGFTSSDAAIVRAHISDPELLNVLDWVTRERSDIFSIHSPEGAFIEGASIYDSEGERSHWYSAMHDADRLAANYEAADTARDPDAYEEAIADGIAFVRRHGLANVNNNNFYRFKGAAQVTDWEAFADRDDTSTGIGYIADVLLKDFDWAPDDLSGFGDLIQTDHGGPGTPAAPSDDPTEPGVYQKRGNRWWQKIGEAWQPTSRPGAAELRPDEPPGPGAWTKGPDGSWRPAGLPADLRPQRTIRDGATPPKNPDDGGVRPGSGQQPAHHPRPAANVPPPPAARAPKPKVHRQDWGAWHATWKRDPMAMVFIVPKGSGVDIDHVARGDNPPRSAGQMIADTLRAAHIRRPSTIRIPGIINKETLEALERGVTPADTPLGRTAQRAVSELGGRLTGWSSGIERDKPWIRADIEYD